MARKPRIVITIVTDESSWEFSSVKGRLNHLGEPCPGPTQEQFDIAAKAIADICNCHDQPSGPLDRAAKESP